MIELSDYYKAKCKLSEDHPDHPINWTQARHEWEATYDHEKSLEPPKPEPLAREKNYTKDINKYFITLTSGTIESPIPFKKSIVRILKQKRLKILDGYGVIELTKKGKPHAHVYLESTKYISNGDIKRIWDKGFIDIRNVKKDNGIKKYQDKDAENLVLRTFLDKWKCERIFQHVSEDI